MLCLDKFIKFFLRFGDEQVLDTTVAAQELLTGAKAAEDLVNPNVNSINVTPARGGEPLVLNTKNLSNNTKIETIDKRTVENNQLNLSQTEKLTESIISKLYIEKDILLLRVHRLLRQFYT